MGVESLPSGEIYFESHLASIAASVAIADATTTVYGNGAWPLLTVYEKGEMAANGNYLEPDSIAVRHGICGDPEQASSYSGP